MKQYAQASVRTGRLQASIRVRRERGYVNVGVQGARNRTKEVLLSGVFVSVVVGSRGARQAYLVEAGHGGKKPAKAHPFFGPAIHGTKEEVSRKVAQFAEQKMPAALAAAKVRGGSAPPAGG